MNAHATIDRRKQPSTTTEVMIFGGGACAQKIAANLADHGIEAWLAASEEAPPAAGHHDGIHWLTGTELSTCRGFAGNFELKLKRGNALFRQLVSAIVVAEDDQRTPNYKPYGLPPHSRVMTITSLEAMMHPQASVKDRFDGGARIAFLCGWQNDSHPAIAKRMLDGCRRLQRRSQVATYFLTGNLKVAATGAETMVQAAKRSGTIFLKFTDQFPTIHTLADSRFEIDCLDELTRMPFRFKADWIVVDESIGPGRHLAPLVQGLGIERDGIGFAQGDNVRRLSNATNRRGIFVAGGSRGILSDDEQLADADQATLRVLAFLQNRESRALPKVEIQRGRCARCLTCHRLCPHHAIEIGSRISVVTAACQSCGICMAGCPARAIRMEGLQIDADLSRRMQRPAAPADPFEKMPRVVVFGCARSAGQAHALTRLSGNALPGGVQIVEAPCGGTISGSHLLAAFEAGADGVMLCTCHTDNCQSEIGNRVARRRAESARDLLTAAGVERDRLTITSVAANMGSEFHFLIKAFVDQIRAIKDT